MAGLLCGRLLIQRPAIPSISFYGSSSVRRQYLCRFGGKSLRKYEPALRFYDLSHLRKSLDARAEVSYVSPEDARKLVREQGYVILDVRDKTQYERAHIKSCYHVPLYIENNDNDFGTIVGRTVHNNFAGLIYGQSFTKLNSEFVSMVQQQFPTDTKLLLVCQEGLRSVVAARKLEAAGYQNLSCITSGLQSVKPGTFDKEGSKELQDAGKAGLVTVQGKISAVLGTILVVAYLFLTLFPDQAEQLFQINFGLESRL